ITDTKEELPGVTLLASRQDKAPALIFEKMQGDTTGSRILTNMLGASRERYALAVGLDPSTSTPEMVQAPRSIMNQPIPPVMIPSDRAPVNVSFKLLLAFAPWIAFLIIAHGSLLRLK